MASLTMLPMLGSLAGRAGSGLASAAAGGGIPWSILLPIVFSGLSSSGLFGGGSNEVEEKMKEAQMQKMMAMFQPKYGAGEYQVNPAMFQGANSAAYQAILNHMKRMANFGYPEGMSMDTSFLDQILSNMPASAAGGYGGGKQRLTSGR